MQFFKSTFVVALAMATYVTAVALPEPQQVCGGACAGGLVPCAEGCVCDFFVGMVSSPLTQRLGDNNAHTALLVPA